MSDIREKTVQKKENTVFNPFPGLRPFGMEESHLFFGREGQSEEVLKHLGKNRFVAVIGASGSGKSSLMYCGVIPALYGGFISDAGSNWRVIATRPGSNPMENLATAIASSEDEKVDEDQLAVNTSINLAVLRRGALGLVEAVKQSTKQSDENVLIVVDQFEELFRFKRSRNDDSSINESEAFVKLLVEAVNQSKVPIYIVLTMRSDFIGDCSQFQELTAHINDSNYLIPQMNREDFRQAILGPVAVGGAEIDPHLVQQLLNEVGDNPDQLPILQHALMRTWDYWTMQGHLDRPINMGDYDAIGRMERALSDHANEAFDELDKEEKRVCESLFKTITEKGNDNRGIRHPTKVSIVANIAKTDLQYVIRVVEIFRQTGRSFLAPSVEYDLDADSVIDLSHESLMRIWDRLKIWVEEEAQAVQMYNRLAEASELYQLGKTGLWRPPDLHIAVNWKEKQRPTLTWAQRYNTAFERAMVYLETSEKDFQAEEQNKIKLQKRQLRRTRVFAIVLGTAAIVALGIMLYAFQLKSVADEKTIEAEEQRVEAEKQTDIAEEKSKEALEALEEARKQTEIAEAAKEKALLNEREAKRQEVIARKQTEIAKEKSAEAIAALDAAEKNRLIAEENARQAKVASDEAYKRRMLSIAQSMSVKALQIDRDPQLKALVAYQAYLFNKEYGGESHHPDVYAGLHSALKSLNKDGFNRFNGHKGGVNAVVFSPRKNILYSAGGDGQLLTFDVNKKDTPIDTLIKNNFINRSLAISANGEYIACGTSESVIQLFNLKTGDKTPVLLEAHDGVVLSLAFSPDGKSLLSTGADRQLIYWNLINGSHKVIENEMLLRSVAFSPSGDAFVTGSDDGKILQWNTNDFTHKVMHHELGNPVYVVAYDSKGNHFATGDNSGLVKLWDVKTGELLNSLGGHNARIFDIEFSPGDRILATSSSDGTVQMWDMNNLNNQPIVLRDHESWVLSVAFSPTGTDLVTTSNKGDLMLQWPTMTRIMATQLHDKFIRDMTEEEWSSFVGSDIEYVKTSAVKPEEVEIEVLKKDK